MKQKFSKSWKSSKQPRKQRKYRANAPLNIRRKFLSCNLSKELRKKHRKRSIVVRKEDKVKVMRGKFKGKQGKVLEVNYALSKIIIEGIQVKKQDGSKVNIRLQPSNLQIIELNLDDKKRLKSSNEKIKKAFEELKKEENKTVKEKSLKTKPIKEKK